ncbi:MAG: phosphate acyltransferase PlsX [Anaerolineales bacterium]|nr:phosphate acyltransferase PlsX [Anaerolineales bacterium]
MNIALDAMGGDNAPEAIVAGAVEAARIYGVTVSLVGRPDVIEVELKKHNTQGLDLPIVAASQVIEMNEKPAAAVRTKTDSSMVVGCKLVKRNEAQAFVSAGNTGGALAAGILHIGRIKGILRPALIGPFPTLKGACMILDVGANADVRPEHIQQFAIMGTIYARDVMGVAHPAVRILSNGEEAGKGNQLVIESFKLLEQTPSINFQGNIESKEIPTGLADVVVTDGFTGNIFVKTAGDHRTADDPGDHRRDQEKPVGDGGCTACAQVVGARARADGRQPLRRRGAARPLQRGDCGAWTQQRLCHPPRDPRRQTVGGARLTYQDSARHCRRRTGTTRHARGPILFITVRHA